MNDIDKLRKIVNFAPNGYSAWNKNSCAYTSCENGIEPLELLEKIIELNDENEKNNINQKKHIDQLNNKLTRLSLKNTMLVGQISALIHELQVVRLAKLNENSGIIVGINSRDIK